LGTSLSASVHPPHAFFPFGTAICFGKSIKLFKLTFFFAFAADLFDLFAFGDSGLFGFPDLALVGQQACVPRLFEVEITATHVADLGR